MKFFKKIQILVVILALVVANLAFLPNTSAGNLTHSSVIEMGGASNVTPMIVATGQSLAIAFTTVSATAANPTITLTFTGWSGGANGSVNTSQTISNAGCIALTGASAGIPGTLAASGSGAVLTITSSGGSNALGAATSYCTELTSTSAVTNPTAGGVYGVTINDGTDSQTDEIDVLTSGANAYTATATVGPTFTMSLTGSPDALGALGTGAVTLSPGIPVTIATNAATGWFVWAEDSNAGLKSTSAGGATIPTVTTGANQTMNSGAFGPTHAAYALGVSANNTPFYAYGGGTTGGGLSTSIFNEIATSASPNSGASAAFTIHELANISNVTPAATDYSDVVTLIGAGSF
jgi:hypothetical protein